MRVVDSVLSGVMEFEPRVFQDERGDFFESYRKTTLVDCGVNVDFVQENQSRSRRHALRGMHYQIHQAQGKLVRVVVGEIFDVVVDLRRQSATFGKWFGTKLSAENRRILWVPEGFAHGFLALSEFADVLYKTTNYYAPEHERCLRWNDPTVGIAWPIETTPLLSAKDALGKSLRESECFD
ncbi:MAG: dTDP-4-dehydrorhamnose 3,5-epimerase [Candidatus Muproteobacteria bacterium RBG_16_60_9]|uniref:dTDP-4-dehydrorhamnose 3,5-epimerase n=1 Tax=Candidatus Muproteobacteria bacterium RBG_16_60_9 TaxID=1817755 RepID=A0A1F6VBU8_9PROT|nr:MAG: dTDP-4-dehydrorhamnose 3,5-epimerase [Candidatus Muproteobacteria bacterium RBG_16_60_9]